MGMRRGYGCGNWPHDARSDEGCASFAGLEQNPAKQASLACRTDGNVEWLLSGSRVVVRVVSLACI